MVMVTMVIIMKTFKINDNADAKQSSFNNANVVIDNDER